VGGLKKYEKLGLREKKKPVWQGDYCGPTSERVWGGACEKSGASAQLCTQKKKRVEDWFEGYGRLSHRLSHGKRDATNCV
jgi:hypothetical protein